MLSEKEIKQHEKCGKLISKKYQEIALLKQKITYLRGKCGITGHSYKNGGSLCEFCHEAG